MIPYAAVDFPRNMPFRNPQVGYRNWRGSRARLVITRCIGLRIERYAADHHFSYSKRKIPIGLRFVDEEDSTIVKIGFDRLITIAMQYLEDQEAVR